MHQKPKLILIRVHFSMLENVPNHRNETKRKSWWAHMKWMEAIIFERFLLWIVKFSNVCSLHYSIKSFKSIKSYFYLQFAKVFPFSFLIPCKYPLHEKRAWNGRHKSGQKSGEKKARKINSQPKWQRNWKNCSREYLNMKQTVFQNQNLCIRCELLNVIFCCFFFLPHFHSLQFICSNFLCVSRRRYKMIHITELL